jgi:hypothetical protein
LLKKQSRRFGGCTSTRSNGSGTKIRRRCGRIGVNTDLRLSDLPVYLAIAWPDRSTGWLPSGGFPQMHTGIVVVLLSVKARAFDNRQEQKITTGTRSPSSHPEYRAVDADPKQGKAKKQMKAEKIAKQASMALGAVFDRAPRKTPYWPALRSSASCLLLCVELACFFKCGRGEVPDGDVMNAVGRSRRLQRPAAKGQSFRLLVSVSTGTPDPP